jgi:thiol-disulfide isomerase/thioredoxin
MMPAKTTTQTFGLFLALALIVAAAPFLWSIQASAQTGGLAVGESMPPIEAAGWVNGPGPSADDLKGKVVVVNGWFFLCRYCHEGAPALVELYEKHGQREDVAFIGLADIPTTREEAEAFSSKYKITWPNAYGPRDRTFFGFDAKAFPAYWIIGRDGKVVWNSDSEREQSMSDALEQAVSS